MNHRPLRVASLIREELSKLIIRHVEFDKALVTITEVDIDKKLEWANVGVSVLPSAEIDNAFKVLELHKFDLQQKLLKLINIRPMPKIRFLIDHGPENAALVEKQFLKIEQNES